MVLATQYSNLQQELATTLDNYAIQPVISTKNNFNLNDIPQLLGTKMEPEMEQEEKQLVENSGLLKDNNNQETFKELQVHFLNFFVAIVWEFQLLLHFFWNASALILTVCTYFLMILGKDRSFQHHV
jgi:hypothetical protein